MAYHAESNVVATGQVGKAPLICVWDPKTLKTESILKGFHKIAVVALSFSKNGKMLVSVDDSDNHQIAIWKWKEGIKVASVNGSKEKVD